jgi:hypothetical protein
MNDEDPCVSRSDGGPSRIWRGLCQGMLACASLLLLQAETIQMAQLGRADAFTPRPCRSGRGEGSFPAPDRVLYCAAGGTENPLLILCFFFAFSAPGGLSAIAPVIWTRRTFLVYAMVRRVEESAFDFRPEVPILIC